MSDKGSCDIAVVVGYHEATPESDVAVAAGLGRRFAVVFDAFGGDVAGPPPGPFVCRLLELIGKTIYYTRLEIAVEDEELGELKYDSFDGFRRYTEERGVDEVGEAEWEMPHTLDFFVGERLECRAEIELWCCVGGPPPYSDSYTLSFYTRRILTREFLPACERACREFGGEVTKVYEASPEPRP